MEERIIRSSKPDWRISLRPSGHKQLYIDCSMIYPPELLDPQSFLSLIKSEKCSQNNLTQNKFCRDETS